jgi:glycosyl transferase family 1
MTRRRIIYIVDNYILDNNLNNSVFRIFRDSIASFLTSRSLAAPLPAGGRATNYQHVNILAKNGFAAYLSMREKPKFDFYGIAVPLLIGNLQLRRGDVCVIPEIFPNVARKLASFPVKRLMFCQNQYYLPFTDDTCAGIAEFGVHGIIASSVAVQNFFRDVYGIVHVPLLPYAVDTKRFAATEVKHRQIAFMPRKLPEDARFIEATFKRRYPHFANIPWVAIHAIKQSHAATIMGKSAIFLSLSHKESFGLPPLEALACGCLVVGYHGDGGHEYMTQENGWWAEMGDWKACVEGLAAAISLFDKGGPELDTRRRAAVRTVEQYSLSRLETELITYWRRELSTPFP